MSENYIVINGKKAELTKEQLKQLGIETKPKRNNPFDRVKEDEMYFYCDSVDNVGFGPETSLTYQSDKRFDASNYFNDWSFANQVMLHQKLYRKLLKYAYDNDAEVTDDNWKAFNKGKFTISYIPLTKKFQVEMYTQVAPFGVVFFKNRAVAESAILEVVVPFWKEHPEFVW